MEKEGNNHISWKAGVETTHYNHARVARLAPVQEAVQKLKLPISRGRKLRAILNALEVQIEDGGDSPEANRCLLDALRAGVRHQVDEKQGKAALRAIEVFAEEEEQRWAQIRAGTLPPIVLTPEQQLDDLMQDGYTLLEIHKQIAGVDKWLEAWEQIKKMATPAMRTVSAFDAVYRDLTQNVWNWCSDVEMELHNAGLDNPDYFAHRIRYVDEFLARFPNEDADRHLSMLRAKAEALWYLDRRSEAEAVFQDIVRRYPDEGWGYIAWSDCYYFSFRAPKEYEPAEALLLQALARPALNDREDVVDRLNSLYKEWGKPEKMRKPAGASQRVSVPPSTPPGRNDPCWCGSGKKYKNCHLSSDRAGGK